MKNLDIIIGGPQGTGLEVSMRILSRLFTGYGFKVLANREYHSNIRGKHSYIHIKVSTDKVRGLKYPVDLIASIDAESIFHHFIDIKPNGLFIYNKDDEPLKLREMKFLEEVTARRIKEKLRELGISDEEVSSIIRWLRSQGVKVLGIKYEAITNELTRLGFNRQEASRTLSTIVSTIISYALGLNIENLKEEIRYLFRGRDRIIKLNEVAIDITRNFLEGELRQPYFKLEVPSCNSNEVLLASGSEYVAMGKVVGGLRFQSYYPITPATDESLYLEGRDVLVINGEAKGNLVVFQTEDELAAIASAIGAALTGVRSATSTSGPGFSLMVEGLSWAGNNEVPIVITYYQRGGPSTGLPTRTSQSDLLFTLFAGHGEFARVVITSGDHEEAFYDAILSLNIAEKYQLPVIHLLDKFLASSIATIEIPKIEDLRIERGKNVINDMPNYKRFDLRYIISPRSFFGQGPICCYTGCEHN